MTQKEEILQKILSGTSDAHIGFDELCNVLRSLGFSERVRGSHFIFAKDGIDEILNIQSIKRKSEVVTGKAGTQHHCEVQAGR